MNTSHQEHWLARSETIRRLWIVFGVVLAALVLADLVVAHHPFFALDATFAFGAWYGFGACVLLVLFAKMLGAVLKRPDSYYDD